MASVFSGPRLSEPIVALVPDQSPLAEHSVASLVVQESVVEPPSSIWLGLALMLTVGAGTALATLTSTLTLPEEPPAPEHVRLKVVEAVSGPAVSEPLGFRVPDHPPDASQLFALLEDQVRVENPPLGISVGSAARDACGWGVGGAVTPSLKPGPTTQPGLFVAVHWYAPASG